MRPRLARLPVARRSVLGLRTRRLLPTKRLPADFSGAFRLSIHLTLEFALHSSVAIAANKLVLIQDAHEEVGDATARYLVLLG